MGKIYRRVMAALTGACTALLVFGVAFAAAPEITPESDPVTSDLHSTVCSMSDVDMENLILCMDKTDLAYIKGTLVEDQTKDIVLSYIQMNPDFATVVLDFALNAK